ncbi:MAG: hypothetical protein K2O15_15615 [Lachnospiraceae bacterium]|nr:hypothetical protein [Lachnospiraceae bacterium]
MRETGKLLLKEILIVVIGAVVGVLALAATYFIPQIKMKDNAWESAILMHREGLGSFMWPTVTMTQLDGYTDGLMLNTSYTETDDGIRDILLDTKVNVRDINPMEAFYEVIALENKDYRIETYGRYWHGYQILWRPLLCFFNYGEIRQINMALQLALVFAFLYLLFRTGEKALVIPFFGMYLFLTPLALFSSMQFSHCFYLTMFASMALIGSGKYLNDTRRNYLFLLTGILTAFFDLLTYPFVTLGIPLITHLAVDRECGESIKKSVKDIFFHTVSWCIGYVGMWGAKWVAASIFTDENVIKEALDQVMFRSGHFEKGRSYATTLRLNFDACNMKSIWVVLICLAVYLLVRMVINYRRIGVRPLPGTAAILLVSLYPFLWYYLTMHHSCDNSYFTWRELSISVYGILLALAVNAGLSRKNT